MCDGAKRKLWTTIESLLSSVITHLCLQEQHMHNIQVWTWRGGERRREHQFVIIWVTTRLTDVLSQ